MILYRRNIMGTPTAAQKPTPERIFNALNAYQQTATLKTAIELDIFTVIAEGAQEAKAIAEKVKASEKGVRVLCDFLTIHGFLNKDGQKYRLMEDAAFFLSKRSPAYLGTIVGFLANDWVHGNFSRLTEIVRHGGSAAADSDNTKPNDEAWVAFAKSMAPMMMPAAQFIAGMLDAPAGKPIKVLDIAAGHGMFGITIAKHNPNAHITELDIQHLYVRVRIVLRDGDSKHPVSRGDIQHLYRLSRRCIQHPRDKLRRRHHHRRHRFRERNPRLIVRLGVVAVRGRRSTMPHNVRQPAEIPMHPVIRKKPDNRSQVRRRLFAQEKRGVLHQP